MSDETLKQIVEKLQGKASAHAINGQNYDKDGFHDLANHEYAMIEAYDDAIKTVIQVAQAEPVVHGEWEHLGGDEWCCTVCENVITTEGSWEKPTQKFCDECGAKMDENNDEKRRTSND